MPKGQSKRLTKKLVEALQCERYVDSLGRERYKDTKVFDKEVPGFFVRLQTPKGGPRYYLQYRNSAGRVRRLPLGPHGPSFTVQQARVRASQELVRVYAGSDPVEERQNARNVPSFKELSDLWLARLLETGRSERGIKEARRLLDTKLLPAFASREWPTISVAEVTRWHGQMNDTPVEANRALSRLSAILNFGQKRESRGDWLNPCLAVSRYPEKRRERFLSDKELADLGHALIEIEQERTTLPSVPPLFRLLILTGARVGELLSLQWENVDFDHACLRLPNSKTGQKIVPLGAPAVKLLAESIRPDNSQWVFPGRRPAKPLVNVAKPWKRICRRAGLEGVRIHDLRHSFASAGIRRDIPLPVIGAILGHSSAATTERYAHLSNDPVRKAVEDTSAAIAEVLMSSEAASHPTTSASRRRERDGSSK